MLSFRAPSSPSATRGHRRWPAVLLGAVLLAVLATPAQAATLPEGFSESQVTAGLSRPYAMAFAPDGRLFVSQQGGKLRVIKNGQLLSQPFVQLNVDSSGDRGLIGVAFDPNFEQNKYVYVYYTTPTPVPHNRVSRFKANGDVAEPGSEEVLLELDNLGSSTVHNGGAIQFGRDGKLYVATGENAQSAKAQSMSSLLGKMLRINPDGSIPTDNPFYDTASGVYRSIWSLGLRNPFTLDIERGTGRMFINDVGAKAWEEIDEGTAGANYGWPDTEGYTTDPRFTSPIFAYGHGFTEDTGCAISGAAFYDPATPDFPSSYEGDYFFADYCTGWIKKLDPAAGNTVTTFATEVPGPIAIETGPDGALYYLTRQSDTAGNPGAVYRIEYSGVPAISSHPSDKSVSPGGSATFSVTASGDQPLSYQWQRDGVDIPGATSASYTLASASLADDGAEFRVVVTNSLGSTTSNAATLNVSSNQAPTAELLTPSGGSKYDAGDTVAYSGAATDPEDGELPASAYEWEIVFHHNTHTHSFGEPVIGTRTGSFEVPTTGETDTDQWYRIRLTVEDSSGQTSSTHTDVHPNVAQITLDATPASPDDGLMVTLDGQPRATPYSTPSIVGMQRSIGAISPQTNNGIAYDFESWSDGGAETHEITTAASDRTYTAAYRERADNVAPETMIGSGPGLTNDPTPDFSFSASETGSTFECKVDGATWSACSSPETLAAQPDGAHTFHVRATDPAGNTDSTPDSRSFTVDTAGPSVTVTSPSAASTVSGPVSLGANASDPNGVYRVKWYVDNVEVASDSAAPFQQTWDSRSVTDGTHKVFAKARDVAGTWSTSRAVTFTVSNSGATDPPPETIIDSGPGLTKDSTPDFSFSASESGSTFECKVDGAAWSACSSPKTLAAQPDGAHTFYVRATDGAGNVDPTPASKAFTVDTVGPTVALTRPAAGATVSGTVTLGADASDPNGVYRVKWYVDGVQVESDSAAPFERAWDSRSVADGEHRMFAKARDVAGTWRATRAITFTVDNNP